MRSVRPPCARNMRNACAVVAKPPGTRTPVLAKLADHFAEGGVLAADRLDVGHPQGVERDDQGGRQEELETWEGSEGREKSASPSPRAATRRRGRSRARPRSRSLASGGRKGGDAQTGAMHEGGWVEN